MTNKIFYPVLVLAFMLFGLQSCEPKSSVKKPVVEATVPTVKTFDIPLDISTMIEMPKSSASTLRGAQEHVLYEDLLSWDLSEIVNSSGLSQAEVKSIRLDKVTMECVKPEGVDLTQVSREKVCNGCWVRAGAFRLWTLCPTDFDFPEGGFS